MNPQSGPGFAGLALAWGAPLILLLVVAIRFAQRRRAGKRRAAASGRTAAGVDFPHEAQPPGSLPPLMRRSDRAITDASRIDSILRSAAVCRIAFAAQSEPYIVPLSFGVADSVSATMAPAPGVDGFTADGKRPCRLYFHSAPDGRKLSLMRENPRVCFEVEGRIGISEGERPCDWTMLYESVIGYGGLSEVTDADEKRAALASILEHHGAVGPVEFPQKMLERTLVIRLDVEILTAKATIPEEEKP